MVYHLHICRWHWPKMSLFSVRLCHLLRVFLANDRTRDGPAKLPFSWYINYVKIWYIVFLKFYVTFKFYFDFREEDGCERKTLISSLLYPPKTRTQPTTQECAQPRMAPVTFWCGGWCPTNWPTPAGVVWRNFYTMLTHYIHCSEY